MTVAAIIEQAQSRWMDQHTIQVLNRFQGSYCNYSNLLSLSLKITISIEISATHVDLFPHTILHLRHRTQLRAHKVKVQRTSHLPPLCSSEVNESKIAAGQKLLGERERMPASNNNRTSSHSTYNRKKKLTLSYIALNTHTRSCTEISFYATRRNLKEILRCLDENCVAVGPCIRHNTMRAICTAKSPINKIINCLRLMTSFYI